MEKVMVLVEFFFSGVQMGLEINFIYAPVKILDIFHMVRWAFAGSLVYSRLRPIVFEVEWPAPPKDPMCELTINDVFPMDHNSVLHLKEEL